MILELKNISKRFGGNQVLNGLNLQLEYGKSYALFGTNGAGKTTLMNVINGQIQQDEGEIKFKDTVVTKKSTHRRAILGILRLWQHSKLFENMSVLDNLLVVRPNKGENLINYLLSFGKIIKEEKKNLNRALEVLNLLELTDKKDNLGKELSGGQKHLLAFGRIMMDKGFSKNQPSEKLLILVDEPFAGVHETLITNISDILKKITNEGHTVLMIEHNKKQAISFSDEVLTMDKGIIKPYQNSNI